MLIACYVGDHASDAWPTRAVSSLTRLVQKGQFDKVTHVESILEQHEDGSVTIASATVREGGVRSKRVFLRPENWWVVDVPAWDVKDAVSLLSRTKGALYDWRGAAATVFLGSQAEQRWFCNEWVGAPFLQASATFSPSQFCAVVMSIGQDVTKTFFDTRQRPEAWQTV